ncbi:hypothetical protein F441_03389 [Phytophthora nicotianae CJ01A1]|uniref:Chromo domain-containing protein n=1 Tax=Phytophthora nicotianae CJ01A1 TaxID=1317063 RepID=W2XKT2_PHYNI|nr:hypothetical protein F441_03389 [Phytophthora nicotianae CJ01A1]
MRQVRDAMVSAVFKTNLRSRFIGPFKVVVRKGLAYTLSLLKKMRTHPLFYVGFLTPYQKPARGSCGAPNWQRVDRPRAAAGQQVVVRTVHGVEHLFETDRWVVNVVVRVKDVVRTQTPFRRVVIRSAGIQLRHGLPPALLDEHGEPHYHGERYVAWRRRRYRTQYLAKWKGYPHSQNSWEFEVPLHEGCPDVVDGYALAHQLPMSHMGL